MSQMLTYFYKSNNFFKRLALFKPTVMKYFLTNYVEKGSVYIHWPYCKQRCSYCNFVKFIPKEKSSWSFSDTVIEDGMIHELESILEISPIKTITSVFFGGGTPSLARPQLTERIMCVIEKKCSVPPNIEITLEANPTSLETKKLKDFKLSGVNRLSLGVQSLQDKLLNLMNRDHSAAEALRCLEEVQNFYSHNLSIDLIFGLPGQTIESWERDLETVAGLSLDHLSLYQLTLERGTSLFNQVKTGRVISPSEDQSADMYELAVDLLAGKGISRYEVSNFARHSWSESSHNKAIWQGAQYIGVGPGAHSRVMGKGSSVCVASCLSDGAREARINATDPRSWLGEVWHKGNGARKVIPQTQLDMQMEYIATSLRTRDGALEENWSAFCTSPLRVVFPPSSLDPAFLTLDSERLSATPRGLNVLDTLLPTLIHVLAQRDSES